MVSITDICRNRKIMPYGIETPILVPSFSSKGFTDSDLADIFGKVSDEITECSLISAYDLCYRAIVRRRDIYASDLLFIDSGGYEKKELYEADGEAYHSTLKTTAWDPEHYSKVLSELKPRSDLVVVTYDDNEYKSLTEQITRANGLLEANNNYAVDFLLKPETSGEVINLEAVRQHISAIVKFSVLGAVEQELGASLVERCTTILGLRMLLIGQGSEMPIHVFGSLDPLRSVLYFLCGADIFDGLAWLRYSFRSGLGRYMAQAALIDWELTKATKELQTTYRLENLEFLRKLQGDMQRFASTYDLRTLERIDPFPGRFVGILEEIGIHK
ncbi:MAG: hypothetical protein HY913_19445 [Desulfomonile tiedjei]|nr:hypothetical protein [Desulfomonile tiedjei]